MLLHPVGASPDPGIVEVRSIKAGVVCAAKEHELAACGIVRQAGFHACRRRTGRMLLRPIAAIPGPGVAQDESPPGVSVTYPTKKHHLLCGRIIGDGSALERAWTVSRMQPGPGRAVPGPGIGQRSCAGVILSAEEQQRVCGIVVDQLWTDATGWRESWQHGSWSRSRRVGPGKLRRHGGMSGPAARL